MSPQRAIISIEMQGEMLFEYLTTNKSMKQVFMKHTLSMSGGSLKPFYKNREVRGYLHQEHGLTDADIDRMWEEKMEISHNRAIDSGRRTYSVHFNSSF